MSSPSSSRLNTKGASTCRGLMKAYCMEKCENREGQSRITAEKVIRNLNNASELRVSGGPFHNMMRAGTYGEIYDEPGWKVNLGIGEIKERSGIDRNPKKCRYELRVLVNNWVEERRDHKHIKYDNSPKLSEYGHIYKSEYGTSYTKPLCNKARDVLLKIKTFPITAHPIHQPDMDVDVIKCSGPKPEGCILDEQAIKDQKQKELCKRYERQDKELNGI